MNIYYIYGIYKDSGEWIELRFLKYEEAKARYKELLNKKEQFEVLELNKQVTNYENLAVYKEER